MSNKQQTAVEWLVEQLRNNENIRWRGTPFFELSEQAKEMEKEQKYKFADEYCNALYSGCPLTPEDYDLTYGGKK